MDILLEFLGTAGYPTSFVAAAIFFIFWHQRMLKSVHENKDGELQRLQQDNRTLRTEKDNLEDEIQLLRERVWRAEVRLELSQGKYPMKGEEDARQIDPS